MTEPMQEQPVEAQPEQQAAPQAHESARPQIADTSGVDKSNPQTEPFSVPDDYKDRGWAKNLKSSDDLWKMLDNAQSVVGKKTVVPDHSKATQDELQAFYGQLKPDSADKYSFSDTIPEAERGLYGNLFHEAGLSDYQAKTLQDKFFGIAKEKYEGERSLDGYKQAAQKWLGDDYESAVVDAVKHMRTSLSEEQQAIIDDLPNDAAVAVFSLVNNLVKDYKITEGGAPAGNAGIQGEEALKQRLADIDKQIHEMARNPMHKQADKSALIQQRIGVLNKIYGNKDKA
jgi:hypothetical protein